MPRTDHFQSDDENFGVNSFSCAICGEVVTTEVSDDGQDYNVPIICPECTKDILSASNHADAAKDLIIKNLQQAMHVQAITCAKNIENERDLWVKELLTLREFYEKKYKK